MTDLNKATLADLTAAGIDPAAAVQLRLWRPYRCWADLDRIDDFPGEQIARLREAGFALEAINDTAWPLPPAFRPTNQAA
ncbi:hypothetical protein BH10PSE3_BH10PSE3_04240 [soil metagenome]